MRLRLAFLLLLGLLLAVAAGCGGGEEVTPTPDNEVPAATGGTDTGTDTGGETETGGGTTDTGGGETTDTGGGETSGGGGGGGGDPAAGKEVFVSAGCVSCHTLADAGATGTVGPNLDEAKPDAALVTDRVTNGAGAMPSFKGQLSEQQIADVSAYVSSVAGS